jgi:hypothetical protein
MRFMMMIKSDAPTEAGALPDEKLLAAMDAYNAQLQKAGAMLAGEGLKASKAGARVRISGQNQKDKQESVKDGPFAEAKELIAGYWLIEARSKQEAIEWAKRVPVDEGEIEIRPLYEAADFADGPADAPPPPAPPPPPPRKAGTTRFMVALKADRNTEAGMRPSPELLAAMGGFMAESIGAGVLLAGDGLKASSAGARVRMSGGKRTVLDGPFTESKEIVAGYAVIQVRSKAEAVAWGTRMLRIHIDGTGIDAGEVDVRPLFELEDFQR